MEAIKDTVINVIEGLKTKSQESGGVEPEGLFKKALTKKEQGHTKCKYFKKGVLTVYVDSASWLYSLALKKENLVSRISKECSIVKDIHFRIGEVK